MTVFPEAKLVNHGIIRLVLSAAASFLHFLSEPNFSKDLSEHAVSTVCITSLHLLPPVAILVFIPTTPLVLLRAWSPVVPVRL